VGYADYRRKYRPFPPYDTASDLIRRNAGWRMAFASERSTITYTSRNAAPFWSAIHRRTGEAPASEQTSNRRIAMKSTVLVLIEKLRARLLHTLRPCPASTACSAERNTKRNAKKCVGLATAREADVKLSIAAAEAMDDAAGINVVSNDGRRVIDSIGYCSLA
jgi:hypothetical protein